MVLQLTRKMGRRRQNYISPTSGKQYDGLNKRPGSNRWTITATGETKRFDDEVSAIAWFTQKTGRTSYNLTTDGLEAAGDFSQATPTYDSSFIQQIPEEILAAFFRQELLNNSVKWANLTGLPQLANFRDMAIPKASIKLADLIKSYMDFAEVKKDRKRNVGKIWERFISVTSATTLEELTTTNILKWKDSEIAKGCTPETIKSIFAAVKAVIAFGLDRAFDAVEIRTALDKCKVLVPPKGAGVAKDPCPIAVSDFHALLNNADDFMQAALLLGLNAALHPGECLAVEWDEIDFEAKTYRTRRDKTGIARASVLWDRTIAAIQKLPRKGKFVFTSPTGLNYSVSRLAMKFSELRTKAGINPKTVFDWLRDGAYSACCGAGVEMQLCMFLAGHKLSGLADHYVLRNSEMVRPATAAVEAKYFPK